MKPLSKYIILTGAVFSFAASAVRADDSLERAADLFGVEVTTRDGKNVGAIDDFVFAADNQGLRLTHAIVSSGGVAGIGDEERAVPIAALSIKPAQAQLSATEAQFQKLHVLPDDPAQHLSDRKNVEQAAQTLGISPSAQRAETPRM